MSTPKFDFEKFFNPEAALTQFEKHAKTMNSYIMDEHLRQVTETMTAAGFEFARTQAQATKAFGDAVKTVFKI